MKYLLTIFSIITLIGVICLFVWSDRPTRQALSMRRDRIVMWDKLSQNDWQLSVPDDGWVIERSDISGIEMIAHNYTLPCMALLIEEAQPDSIDQTAYAMETIRILGADGARITAIKPVVYGDNKFVVVKSIKDRVAVMTWITLHDQIGFTLSCVGTDELCQSIANTLVLP